MQSSNVPAAFATVLMMYVSGACGKNILWWLYVTPLWVFYILPAFFGACEVGLMSLIYFWVILPLAGLIWWMACHLSGKVRQLAKITREPSEMPAALQESLLSNRSMTTQEQQQQTEQGCLTQCFNLLVPPVTARADPITLVLFGTMMTPVFSFAVVLSGKI